MLVRYCIFFFLVCTHLSKAQKQETLKKFGEASFYDDSFHGLETSNGETYDKTEFTAAHRSLPFNTILLVTNKENNKSVVVRVNDRGPFRKSRILDLSRAAAKKIGMVPFGVVPVKIKVLEFLNPLAMADSLLQDGEIWDCYGVKKKYLTHWFTSGQQIIGNTPFIWPVAYRSNTSWTQFL
jgi:rare lipoprotein A (peptidoglycan hydrolase)